MHEALKYFEIGLNLYKLCIKKEYYSVSRNIIEYGLMNTLYAHLFVGGGMEDTAVIDQLLSLIRSLISETPRDNGILGGLESPESGSASK